MTTTLTIKHLNAAEVKALYESGDAKLYQKSGKFLARPAEPNETLLTLVAGKLETMATAEWGQVVIQNIQVGSSAERYLIDAEKYAGRYEDLPGGVPIFTDGHSWKMVKAKGQAMAFEYQGETVHFEAPWGADMILEAGDFLARPPEGPENDIYRIERATFLDTYELVK